MKLCYGTLDGIQSVYQLMPGIALALVLSLSVVPGNLSGETATARGDVSDSNANTMVSGVAGALGTWEALPIKAARVHQVFGIAAGPDHSLAIQSDGSVIGWGYNYYGQTITPSDLGPVSALAAGDLYSLALSPGGTLRGWGNTSQGEMPPPGISDVVSVSAGGHALALRRDGTVVAWGSNDNGQCNTPAGLSHVIAVAAGGMHSLALKSDGTIRAWGNNQIGQCNIPSDATNVVAIAAGQWHSAALLADGSVRFWAGYMNNWSTDGRPSPSSLRDVVAISAGGYSVLAMRRGGAVIGWGGYEGNVPAGLAQVVGVSAGYTTAMAMHGDGSLTTWDEYSQPTGPGELAPSEAGPDGVYAHLGYLENNGTDILTDVRAVIDGPDADQFSVLMTQVTNIACGGKSAFAVRFYPTRLGPLSADLKLYSNAPDSPFVLPLNGSGNFEITSTKAGNGTGDFTYGPLRLDRYTGLLLQQIRFTNTTGMRLRGLRLFLSRLAAGVEVYSSSLGDKAGTVEVLYSNAIAPGETIVFDLTYYDSKRRRAESIIPVIKAEAIWVPIADGPPVTGTMQSVSSVRITPEGPLLMWKSIPKSINVVEYSDDGGAHWLSAVHMLRSGANQTSWLDRGQPETKTKPVIITAPLRTLRLYRIKVQ